ncbi:MAG: DUF4174 domain-containing protein [Oculatellaceae cyanobacterium bins.114]|nr:DUF4174 domain-containing protein [Oculatellaceae cyanobacterium bins.114]
MNDSSNSTHVSPSEASRVDANPDSAQSIDFDLNEHQWQHRILLVFAPSAQSSDYQHQLQQWNTYPREMSDRDLKLVEVLGTGTSQADGQSISAASAERLRQHFGVTAEEFVVILVGKDGTEKQRRQTSIEPTTLFQTIDAMPMRQQEMRSRP